MMRTGGQYVTAFYSVSGNVTITFIPTRVDDEWSYNATWSKKKDEEGTVLMEFRAGAGGGAQGRTLPVAGKGGSE